MRHFVIAVLAFLYSLSGLAVAADAVVSSADPDSRIERIAQHVDHSQYAQALEAGRSLLEELKRSEPEGGLDEARLLDQLVAACARGSEVMNPEALAWADRAVALKRKLLGEKDPGLATSLAALGNLRGYRREPKLAVEAYLRAKEILESTSPEYDEELAQVLSSLGAAYRHSGERDRALVILDRARGMQERLLGDSHPDLASTLNNQAILLTERGEYAAAARLHRRAMEIRERAFGPDSEWVAESANNLANQLGYLGRYDEALAVQERVVEIFAATLGSAHARTWLTRLNLAILYQDMGDRQRAEPIFAEVHDRLGEILGPGNIDLIWVLDAWANNHYLSGDPARALELYRQSLQLSEARWGAGSLDTANTIGQIGKCLIGLDQPAEAIEALTRSIAILRSDLPADNALLIDPLHERARAYLQSGDPAAALRDVELSRMLGRRDLGREHPLLATSALLAARSLRDLDQDTAALDEALEAERIASHHLQMTLPVLSEQLALQYADSRTDGVGLALSLLSDGEEGARVERVWDAVIRSRAAVLDQFVERNRMLHAGNDPVVSALIDSSRAVREQLAHLTLRGPGWEELGDYRQMLDDAQGRLHELDRELSLHSGAGPSANTESIGLAELKSSLPAGAALVAYVRETRTDGPRYYGAFLLSGPDRPAVYRRIGTAEEVDTAVSCWREQVVLGGTASRGFVNVERDSTERLAACAEAGRTLRRRIWDPVATGIADAATIFLVPAGGLHLISFAALPNDDGRYLIELDPILHTLSAEREIVTSAPAKAPARELLALGGADYGHAGHDGAQRFAPLPHSSEEVRALGAIWRERDGSVRLLGGAEATERRLKQEVAEADVLHLATHGFFLPAPQSGDTGGVGANPLVRSGLALTGANAWGQSGAGADDGILTAQEIAGLDLGRLRWVVLSACDTGLGDLGARGEGVFGLRRAFALAGAHTVIMSLWPVQDAGARVWMEELYTARWKHGSSTCEAVRSATRTLLAQRREAGLSDHPYHWAGFIAAGDWR